jgi:hypothetical protein
MAAPSGKTRPTMRRNQLRAPAFYISMDGSPEERALLAQALLAAPGKLADLILIDGDPTARISDIRRATTVVKDGTVYQTSTLYQAIGVRPLR